MDTKNNPDKSSTTKVIIFNQIFNSTISLFKNRKLA